MSESRDQLRSTVKSMIVETLMLRREPESIANDAPLLGPEGLGLDSIDTVTLLAEIERKFGITVRDPSRAQSLLKNVDSLVDRILTPEAGGAV